MIKAGEAPSISEFDNVTQLVIEFNRFRKGDEFDAMEPLNQGLLLQAMEDCLHTMLKLSNAIPPEPEETMQTNPIPEQDMAVASDEAAAGEAETAEPLPPEDQGEGVPL